STSGRRSTRSRYGWPSSRGSWGWEDEGAPGHADQERDRDRPHPRGDGPEGPQDPRDRGGRLLHGDRRDARALEGDGLEGHGEGGGPGTEPARGRQNRADRPARDRERDPQLQRRGVARRAIAGPRRGDPEVR